MNSRTHVDHKKCMYNWISMERDEKKCGKPNMKKTQKTKNKDEKKTWVLNVIKTNR